MYPLDTVGAACQYCALIGFIPNPIPRKISLGRGGGGAVRIHPYFSAPISGECLNLNNTRRVQDGQFDIDFVDPSDI